MIIYDNYGVLMGRHSLSELNSFRSLLYYQLTGNFYYFDILIMRNDEINEFYKLEIEYFRDNISDQILRKAAHNAIQFIENVS